MKAVHAFQGERRGLTIFKNMPFLDIEDALLGARKASSSMLNIIH